MDSPDPYRYAKALQTVVNKPRGELLRLIVDQSEDLGRRTAAFTLLTAASTTSKVEPLLLTLDDVALWRHSLYVVGCALSLAHSERRDRLSAEDRAALPMAKPRITAWLLTLLEEDGDHFFAASNALAAFRDDRLIPWCLVKLSRPDPTDRTRAVRLLGRLGTEHAQQILETMFQTDPFEGVRYVAAIMLGLNGNPIAQETLLRCPLSDWSVLIALCCLKHPEAIAELKRRIPETSDDMIIPMNLLAQRLLPQLAGVAEWRPIVIKWADEQLRAIEAGIRPA